MYAFGERSGVVAEGINPARRIEQFRERPRERFLTGEELERLGLAIREAEDEGHRLACKRSETHGEALPKAHNRFTIDAFAAAAIRLLLFTGCRLREILHLRWDQVDSDRGLLFLAGDSKTGKKTIILNAPALAVMTGLDGVGPYVIPGSCPANPRADLKRPWEAVVRRAGLEGVRLHDLRHTYASFGAGSGLGLPIIGKLLRYPGVNNPAICAP